MRILSILPWAAAGVLLLSPAVHAQATKGQFDVPCWGPPSSWSDDLQYPSTGGWAGVGVLDDPNIPGREHEISGDGWSAQCWDVTLCKDRPMHFWIHDITEKFGHSFEVWIDGEKKGATAPIGTWGFRACLGQNGSHSDGDFVIPLTAGLHHIRVRFAGFDGHSPGEVYDSCMFYPNCQIKWSWPVPKVVAKGRMAYRDSTISVATDMRSIQLALYDKNHDGTERFLNVRTKTDQHGYFTFPCIDNVDVDEGGGPLDLFVRAYFMSDSTGFPEFAPVVKPVTMYRQDGSVWYWDTPPIWDCQGIEPNHSVMDFGTQKPPDTDYPHNTAMHIYTTMLRGWDWVNARANPMDYNLLMGETKVHWDWEWPQQTQDVGPDIYINGHGDKMIYAPDEWDDKVLLHEYGHRVAARYNFADSTTVNSHSGLAEVKDAWGRPTTGGAWDEGWAEFFGAVTQTVGGSYFMYDVGWNPNTPVSQRNRQKLTLEDGWYSQEDPVNQPVPNTRVRVNSQGATWEWPVAGTLWDMYDSANDNQPDNTCGENYAEDPTHTYIFNACRVLGTNYNFDVYRFYDQFKAQHPEDTTVTKIRNLFCEHGINVMNRSGDRLAKDVLAPRLDGAPRFALLQSAPNPFRGRTVIPFALAQAQAVHMAVFDLRGRLVARLVNGTVLGPGAHVVAWSGQDDQGVRVAPGVYLYRIQTGGFVDEKKLIILP